LFCEKNQKMIQRIQSVFLLLLALTMLAMLFLPIWALGVPEEGPVVMLDAFRMTMQNQNSQPAEVISSYSTWYIAALSVVAAGLALFSISQYKNRLTQIKIGALNSLVIGGVVLSNVLLMSNGGDMLEGAYAREYKAGFIVPVAALIFNSLANRFIRRDEKLVRSADRMR
jgi:uncharacterized membrane protein YoaK (UPF0700 family)